MPASKRPRKQYRPKPVGRPVLHEMRRDLVLPCYSALSVLQLSDDAEAMESAWHTIAALTDYMWVALRDSGKEHGPMLAGMDALRSMSERHKRLGSYRPTGEELGILRRAVAHADESLGLLRTDELIRGCHVVDQALFGHAGKGVSADLR